MTYNVFSGTLNLIQSNHDVSFLQQRTLYSTRNYTIGYYFRLWYMYHFLLLINKLDLDMFVALLCDSINILGSLYNSVTAIYTVFLTIHAFDRQTDRQNVDSNAVRMFRSRTVKTEFQALSSSHMRSLRCSE